jgi:HPt (histidine-containing phosphotransfer) domain-containing protein
MTADEAPILDAAVIAELRESTGDDDEFIRELVDAYIAEATGYLEAMKVAAAAGDPSAIVRPSHTLKSSSATIGAMRLAAICRGIEEAGRAGRADGMAGDVKLASATWEQTLAALTAAGLAG